MGIIEELNKGPIILDNVLPLELSQKLQRQLYEVTYFNLGSSYEGTSGISNESLKNNNIQNIYEQFQLSYSIVHTPANMFDSKFYHLYVLPLTIICLQFNIIFDINSLFRCKLNFQTRAPKESKNKYNWPHIDIARGSIGGNIDDYITVLYYVNDSDGDTYFFNEDTLDESNFDEVNNLTIKKQVTPKQGRAIIFNTRDIHAGAHPIENDFRMVINYNLKIK